MIPFLPNCCTTAMGIMPHREPNRAVNLALSLDIPFWPQLPNVSYFEDMYAQASEHFPGLVVDQEAQKIVFDSARLGDDLSRYSEVCDDEETFSLSDRYSVTYRNFLARDLSKSVAIRGQVIGPVSFGFRIMDNDRRPIIYDDSIRPLLFEFIQRKVNQQYQELKRRNPAAFVWLDEPGLGWVFSALAGYPDNTAREDYNHFLAGIEGIRALHLCADINLPYLCSLDLDLLSCDAYQIGHMPGEYAKALGAFLDKGGTLAWGIVPTDSNNRASETANGMAGRLLEAWRKIQSLCGTDLRQIGEQSLIAPARCCLKNVGKVGAMEDVKVGSKGRLVESSTVEETLVEGAFADLATVANLVKEAVGLSC